MIETLLCQDCGRTWERDYCRGPKPKRCPECKERRYRRQLAENRKVLRCVRKCAHCGAEFLTWYSGSGATRIYCSKACRDEAMGLNKWRLPKPCERCGQEFVAHHHDQRYCTPECGRAAGAERKTLQREERTCPQCGETFIAKVGRSKKYCSRACSDAARAIPRCTCKQCGREFKPKCGDRTTYCSRECAFAHKARKPVSAIPRVERAIIRQIKSLKRKAIARKRARDYQREHYSPKPRVCVQCGTHFISRQKGVVRYCSTECSEAAALAAPWRPPRRSGTDFSRRVRTAIYERDNYTCQICGEPVDLDAHYLDDWYPSLDHIVPQSMGGSHAMSNLRCAHRICNSIRHIQNENESRVVSAILERLDSRPCVA